MCERNIDGLPPAYAVTKDRTHNPSMCPDQESNWQPSALWDEAQPTEPHQSGLNQGILRQSMIPLMKCYQYTIRMSYLE